MVLRTRLDFGGRLVAFGVGGGKSGGEGIFQSLGFWVG